MKDKLTIFIFKLLETVQKVRTYICWYCKRTAIHIYMVMQALRRHNNASEGQGPSILFRYYPIHFNPPTGETEKG